MTDQILHYGIIAANVIVSMYCFNTPGGFERLQFNVGAIRGRGEWYRLVTSAFVHVNMTHLLFNMLTFYFFYPLILRNVWWPAALGLYVGALLVGNLCALFFHRDDPNYSAVGASGAVSGVLYAAILWDPDMMLYLFFALPIKAWVFGIAYLLYTIFGIQRQGDNIGHEAHLGGALFGILGALVLFPDQILDRPLILAALIVPTVALFAVAILRPDLLNRRTDRWDA